MAKQRPNSWGKLSRPRHLYVATSIVELLETTIEAVRTRRVESAYGMELLVYLFTTKGTVCRLQLPFDEEV